MMMMRQLVSAALFAGVFVSSAVAGEVRYTGDGHAYTPSWSADGKYLAFEVNNYGDRSDLHISEVSGDVAKDAKKVSLLGGGGPFSGAQILVNPTWHPAGLVVFEGSNSGGQYRLYLYRPGGGSASEMISTAEVPGDITFPGMNKSASSMLFVADRTGNGDINIRDSNTGNIDIPLKTNTAEMFPQFNDKGSKILFTREKNNAHDVFELTVATGVETPVVGGSHDQSRPIYAADGRVVFFDNSRDGTAWDLVTVAGPGASKKVLAKSIRLPHRARPALSPDGKWVSFAYEDPTKSSSIYLMKVDGSSTVKIPSNYSACGEPAIGVQGGKVLLAYTALPDGGADYRSLYVTDITGKL